MVFAAGALGTQRLLHRMRGTGQLPGLSARLGALTRTNSESILGASVPRRRGPPARARLHRRRGDHQLVPPRPAHPHRAGALRPGLQRDGAAADRCSPTAARAGALRWLGTLAAPSGHRGPGAVGARAGRERTVIALVMQSLDNSLTVRCDAPGTAGGGSSPARATARPTRAGSRPATRPCGCSPRRSAASPGGSITEVFDIPVTAHILGGAVDRRHARTTGWSTRTTGSSATRACTWSTARRSARTSGVNPSLTITAQAERAMSFWPNKGEPDPRPPLGYALPRLDPRSPRTTRPCPPTRPRRPPPRLALVGVGTHRARGSCLRHYEQRPGSGAITVRPGPPRAVGCTLLSMTRGLNFGSCTRTAIFRAMRE